MDSEVSSGSVDQDHRGNNESDEEDEEEANLAILKSGKSFTYTIPSFPVYSAQLRHVRYQMLSNSVVSVFDGFMREDPSLDRNYPATAVITRPDVFTVQVCSVCVCVCVCLCVCVHACVCVCVIFLQ